MSIAPVIIITGASSGIGEAAARLFAEEGWRVVAAARREDRLNGLVAEIQRNGGQALAVRTDVSCQPDIDHLVHTSLAEMGQIDLLFNNAGFGRMNYLERLDPDTDIEAQIRVNLVGVILASRAVLPHMIERGRGHIINMASIAGFIGTPTYSIYAASKFGVRGFTEALRREVSPYGIRVSGIYPGGTESEFVQHMGHRTGLTTPHALRLSSEQVAQGVLKLSRRPQRVLVMPGVMNPVIWFNILFPWAADWGIQRFVRRKDRGLY